MELWNAYVFLWKTYFTYKLVLLICMVIDMRRASSEDADQRASSRWWVLIDLPGHFPYYYSRAFQSRYPCVQLVVIILNAAFTGVLVGPFVYAIAKQIVGR